MKKDPGNKFFPFLDNSNNPLQMQSLYCPLIIQFGQEEKNNNQSRTRLYFSLFPVLVCPPESDNKHLMTGPKGNS